MPDEPLDAAAEADRAGRWRQRLDRTPSPTVAVAEDGTVVGFIAVGAAEDGGDARSGEVHAISVDPDHWGQGAGCDLLATGVMELDRSGFERALVWVEPANLGARRFFELHGWSHDGVDRQRELPGGRVQQTRYSRPLT